jgi:hypothetical protein
VRQRGVAKESKLISSEQKAKIFISSRSGLHSDPGAIKLVVDIYPTALRNLIVETGGLTTNVRQFTGIQIRALMPGVCSSEEARLVGDEP